MIPTIPSPPPPIATGPPKPPPPPPMPRRSSTWVGSSRAPGLNLTRAAYLQVACRKRGERQSEHQREEHGGPHEQRAARVMGAAERPEREHELGKSGRVGREPVQRVLVERVERERPPREARDVLQAGRVDRVPDLTE